VVVGGNFTGVEAAGEFHLFLRQASKRYPNLDPDDCRVTLVEIADRILPGMDDDLSRYAVAKMRGCGIEFRLLDSVKRIEEDKVTLDSGTVLPTCTVIWCAGIAPNPMLAGAPLPKDEQGWVLCDRVLRVKGYENVWAIGDCAVNPDREGKPYPATAQHATRQAQHLAVNLTRVLNGQEPVPFDYTNRGSLVGLGCRTGVAKVFGIKLSGFAAWFLWRTVYLLKLPGWGRLIPKVESDLFFAGWFYADPVERLQIVIGKRCGGAVAIDIDMRRVALADHDEGLFVFDPVYFRSDFETLGADIVEPRPDLEEIVEIRRCGVAAVSLENRYVGAVGNTQVPVHLHLANLEIVHEAAIVDNAGGVRFAVTGPDTGSEFCHDERLLPFILAQPFVGASVIVE
jgi:hypothetical protein